MSDLGHSVSYFPVTNHSKLDPADQIRTERLGGAHCGHCLFQSTDVGSDRQIAAQGRDAREEIEILLAQIPDFDATRFAVRGFCRAYREVQ